MNSKYKTLLLMSTFLYSLDAVSAPFDDCPTEAFLSQYKNGATHYKSVDLSTGLVSTLQTDDDLGADSINAIAFNSTDHYIYGFDRNKLALVKLDSDFKATVLNFTNPPNNNFYVGDIKDNKFYFYRRYLGLYYTNLDSNAPDYLTITKVVGSNKTIRIADFAFHPTDGNIYAVEGKSGKLYQIDPTTGVATNVANTGFTSPGSAFGAAYFDSAGYLYFLRNKDGNIYRTDITDPNNITGASVYFAKADASNSNDGARCSDAPVISTDTDYGDAPDSYGTSLGVNGARHLTDYSNYILGDTVDAESDANLFPNSDDTDNLSDEDGILFQTALITGLDAQIMAIINGGQESAYFNGWIDWNQDGDFEDAGEHVFDDLNLTSDLHNLTLTVPATAAIGSTWARFRLGDQDNITSTGGYANGEVEDYPVQVSNGNTTSVYYPSEDDFVTLAYEDRWPERGDYDFNDVVIYYRVVQTIKNNEVSRVDIQGQLVNYGATYFNGFAVHLPGILRSNVDESSLQVNYNSVVSPTTGVLELYQTDAVVVVSDNLKSAFVSSCGNKYFNTESGCMGNSSSFTFEIKIPMVTPINVASMPAMPLNPFIFATENRNRNDFFGGPVGRDLEIHLPDMPITDLGSTDYFGLLDDVSNPPTTTYRNSNNLPWAVEIGNTEWKAPLESIDISSAYPEFNLFITSGGTFNEFWFDNPVFHRIVD
ncbi:LruC domain-containing protein [Moritella sp. 24]|uniref:LruC domain-containing protein n=1 Tax=Moritella sp. 24 TaxID=2746230 RepID=UPI001BAB8382|nr:LruC domain-containing protein [Moritella sp. 24]QUM77408.1 LruC domain-containing protein [Moritella sp. 24]